MDIYSHMPGRTRMEIIDGCSFWTTSSSLSLAVLFLVTRFLLYVCCMRQGQSSICTWKMVTRNPISVCPSAIHPARNAL